MAVSWGPGLDANPENFCCKWAGRLIVVVVGVDMVIPASHGRSDNKTLQDVPGWGLDGRPAPSQLGQRWEWHDLLEKMGFLWCAGTGSFLHLPISPFLSTFLISFISDQHYRPL